MKIISGIYWDKGMRSKNQDSLFLEQVFTNKGRVLIAAVSDGIGGLEEGETASGFILEKLLESFYHQMVVLIGRGKGKKALKRSLLRCFFETNQMLNQYARSRDVELGATVSVLLIWKKKYLAAHLGDSRIYQFKEGGSILQLTKDHSDGKNALTRCMGSFAYQSPDMFSGKIKGKAGFLLCSDGFYHCPDKRMLVDLFGSEEVEDEEQIEKRLKELACYDIKRGEQDNISALYILCSR